MTFNLSNLLPKFIPTGILHYTASTQVSNGKFNIQTGSCMVSQLSGEEMESHNCILHVY